jgi:hypothetical protein
MITFGAAPWGTRFYWENLATSWRRKPIVISAIPRRPHQRIDHECQIGRRRPETAMRCAKNLINSITAPMNDKINPQIFSVLGVICTLEQRLTIIRAENSAFNYGVFRPPANAQKAISCPLKSEIRMQAEIGALKDAGRAACASLL